MLNLSLLGACAGGIGALGLLLICAGLPHNQRPTLDDRLAPYVRDAAPESALLRRGNAQPRGALDAMANAVSVLLRPVFADLIRVLERVGGGAGAIRRRLDQAGLEYGVEEFRAQQVVWGVVGFLIGLLLALLIGLERGFAPPVMLAAIIVSTLLGVLARDQWLTQAVRTREQRILTEFPTVAELLALSVSAGEGPIGALERVASSSTGELAGELRRTLADARAGASLIDALQALATRTSLPIVARFVDGVAVAVERGTPLAEVLRSQAGDVRAASRRQLMESGGKREIAMMAPVVFAVLPVTVVFAIYPGIAVLGLQGPYPP